jgi:copper chaperone CopZ
MKQVVLVGLLSGVLGLSGSTVLAQSKPAAAKPATQVATFKVNGMTCAGCGAAVKIAAMRINGVSDVKVNYAKTTANITYDTAKTNPAAIAQVITKKTGFKTTPTT